MSGNYEEWYRDREVDKKADADMIAVREPVWHVEPPQSRDDASLSCLQDRFEEDGLPVFRKIFEVDERLMEAGLDITSLGIFHVYINGKTVTGELGLRDELKPGWTDYRKRLFYYTYDVRPYLHPGENCILAVVGSGWWQGRIAFGTYGRRELGLWGCLRLKNQDGSCSVIRTGKDWEGFWTGPVRCSDIWDGELYDAREDSYEAMSLTSYEGKPFESVHIIPYEGKITACIGPKVQIRPELSVGISHAVVSCGVDSDGSDFGTLHVLRTIDQWPLKEPLHLLQGQRLTVDTGQNMVGWQHVKARAAKGTMLTVRFAEMLNDSGLQERGNDGPKGSVYTANYRTAKSLGRYVFRGCEAGETYWPYFTYYGFRYLEFTADDEVVFFDISVDTVSSVIPETGSLETSDKAVNQLISNIVWGQRGNYVSVPTDCPQRNERLGWTGDAQVFFRTASYCGDVEGFFWKWLQDARDSQNDQGGYPDVIPYTRVIRYGNGAWADACIIIPYRLYLQYGSRSLLEVSIDSMERYMEFLSQYGLDGPNIEFGDWLAYEPTDKRYVSMAYYAYDAMLMEKMERLLGREEKAGEYRTLYQKIRDEFLRRYWKAGKGLTQQSQTAFLLALMIHVLPAGEEEAIMEQLTEKIRDNGFRLSTGFVGTGILMQTLSEYGQHDMAYHLLMQHENPSWLYSVDQGATTIWERWNSYMKSDGFGDVGMNSFNHYAYGCVGEWMYRYMAGIETIEDYPGFEVVVLQPKPDLRRYLPEQGERITWVKASYQSRRGRIMVRWELKDSCFYYQVTLEEGMEGILYLPELPGVSGIRKNGEAMLPEEREGIWLTGGTWEFEMAFFI